MTTGPPLLVLLPAPDELPLLPPLEPPLLLPPPPSPGEVAVEPPHAIAMATPVPRNATIRILVVRMKA
jgi:hypothetical protein